jgi:hypothetical protein
MDNVLFFPENTEENKAIVSANVNEIITKEYAPKRLQNKQFYVEARGGSPQTLFDCWYYKCAEFASSNFLHEKYNLPLVEPDTKIYKSSEKNWNADISYKNVTFLNNHFENLRFHNKSVTSMSAQRYEESFMFQLANRNGRGGKDKILKSGNENDYCIFVYVPYNDIAAGDLNFYIRGIIPWTFIKENGLLENPKKPSLIGQKLCVYTKSLRKKFQTIEV